MIAYSIGKQKNMMVLHNIRRLQSIYLLVPTLLNSTIQLNFLEINDALDKWAKQSSTHPPNTRGSYDAKYGNDRDLSTRSVTSHAVEKWFKINFGEVFRIQRIVLKGDEEAFKTGHYQHVNFIMAMM